MTDVDATVEGWDFSTGRFWSYSKKDWSPKWPFRWGVPEIGNTDEFMENLRLRNEHRFATGFSQP